MELTHKLKEKFSSWGSILSSSISFLGGYQVCHSVCLGIITVLAIIGITVTGMPLLFLQSVAVPFWITALVLLVITLGFYFRKKCISPSLILLNTGIIIAGTPFSSVQVYSSWLWAISGTFIFASILLFIKKKFIKHP